MQQIVGESSSLAETLDHVSRLAPIDRPVLILGERGSGKELIAERMHFLSSRWGETFLKTNCAAISEALLDSELFGHEAGAFTNATRTQLGRFERADGGTLFLDELGAMPLRIQEKILRVIEYGEFERLGGQKTLKVDVRIVAATHADLPKMARKGQFRHDLLDRLAFDVITVPPLKHRREDIPSLVEHFATRMCSELGYRYYAGFNETALETLLNHSWPGNIRELKNVVERSMCRWQNMDEPIAEVVIDPFSTFARQTSKVESDESEPEADLYSVKRSFHETIQSLEIKLLREALSRCNHHQRITAEHLGMSYHQLRALLKKHKASL